MLTTALASVRVRLFVVILLAVVPAVGLILHTSVKQRQLAVAEAQSQALRLARLVAASQATAIEEARLLLTTLANVNEVRRLDAASCSDLFRRLRHGFPAYANLGVVTPDGRLFCSALPAEGVNLADRRYIRRAIDTREFSIGEYQIGRVTRRASLNVGYPLVEEGVVRAVLFAALDLDQANRLVKDANLPPGSTLTIVDENGTVLVRHPNPERWVGHVAPRAPSLSIVRTLGTGVAEAAGLDGVDRLLGFSPLLAGHASGNVYASIGIPREAAVAAVDRLLTWNLAGLLGAAALAMMAAWIVGDLTILKRVRALVTLTRRVSAGDLTARAPGADGGELGQLSRAFNDMTGTLATRQRDLAATVEALRESAERLQGLIDASPLAIVTMDREGIVATWNPAAERIFGWPGREVVGRRNPTVAEDRQAESQALRERAFAGAILSGIETKRRARDGRVLDVVVSTAPVHDATGAVREVLIIYDDVTERRRTAEQVRQQQALLHEAEKLAALGRLAAGVAHELRNPLTVIAMRTELLHGELAATDRSRRHLAHLQEAAARMSRIVQGLSAYSKPSRAEPTELDAGDLIEAIPELLGYQTRQSAVRVACERPPEPVVVLGDRSAFMQILLNLAVNAVEAMSETGGDLTLRTHADGDRAVIEVADTGPGIASDTLATIWEPFFTTKREGTGLGLSIVRSLAEEQGARIEVASEPGRGTIFRLTLPRVAADTSVPARVRAAS